MPQESRFLRARLWNSINGLCLAEDGALYLGLENAPLEDGDDEEPSEKDPMEDLMADDSAEDDVMSKLSGEKENQPEHIQRNRPAKNQRTDGNRSDSPNDTTEEFKATESVVLRLCPGMLSVCVEGELAYNRGLTIDQCKEYDRIYVDKGDVDQAKYPYHLGDLYMDKDLLEWMKKALLLLKPDGFYLSPSRSLYDDVAEAYKHIEAQSNKLRQIFPDWGDIQPPEKDEECLYHATRLCNELQRTRKIGRAASSVDDMRLLAKASNTLALIISPAPNDNGTDLAWAMLACPQVPLNIISSLQDANLTEVIAAEVVCDAGILDCRSLLSTNAVRGRNPSKYVVPFVGDGKFTGKQVLAALADIFIRFFWIDKRWITDVAPEREDGLVIMGAWGIPCHSRLANFGGTSSVEPRGRGRGKRKREIQ
jgi:hypothetical protein